MCSSVSIKMKQRGINKDSRISELPEFLLQHIQYFLPTIDANRSSLLSKSWFRAWSTRPVLDFDQSTFGSINREIVDNTLARYDHRSLCIEKFRIIFNMDRGEEEDASLVNKWLFLVLRNKVRVLNLNLILTPGKVPWYIVPAFTSMSLTSLELTRVRFVVNDTQFTRCPNLKKLILYYVFVDDHTIQHLSSCFPLLEEFHFTDCKGYAKLRVANLLCLKLFSCGLSYYRGDEVLVEAPRLQSFVCGRYAKIPYGQLRIEPYRNLRCFLLYKNTSITDTRLRNLLSECPLLEELSLNCCYSLERIQIVSHSLKRLWLVSSFAFEVTEVTIDAPNLCSLDYKGHKLSYLSFVTPLTQARAQASIRTGHHENLDAEWFGKLGSLLKRFKTSSLTLCSSTPDTEEFIANPPSPGHQVEVLNLSVEHRTTLPFWVLVSGLFSTCHPKMIIVLWDNHQAEFIHCLCKELLRRRIQNQWGVDQVSCWWHYLEDAKLEIRTKTRGKWIQLGRKRFLAASMNLERATEIRFTLRWCRAEEY